jgi:transposase
MAEPLTPVEEILATESEPAFFKTAHRYEDNDFRLLYEREYHAHKETRQKLDAAEAEIVYLKQRVEKLEADNVYLRKLLFSKKTEKYREIAIEPEPSAETAPKTHGAQKGHKGHGRKIPFHLPTQDHRHSIHPEECFCSSCGLPFKELNSEEISYEVTIQVQYILFRHRRKKYRKTCRCGDPIIVSPGPLKLFAKGMYSMDFWIQVLLDKYAYGMPLERQAKKMAGEGLEVSPGVLTAGLLRSAPYLKPLYELMIEKIAFEKLVHADETRWKNWAGAYDAERKEEKSLHWLWGLFSGRYRVFVIDPSRGAKVIKSRLGQGEQKTIIPNFVCDRYKAYQSLGTSLYYCWAHVRRDFLKLQTQYRGEEAVVGWAQREIDLIGEMYALNRLRVKHKGNKAVLEGYENQIREVLGKMQDLMKQDDLKPAQKALAKSMDYHWEGLIRFLEDPKVPLDNNLAERELRTPVVGRKNFYGTHSDRATEATAIFYSMISTCKQHGVSPQKFLKRYLTTYVKLYKSRASPPVRNDWLKSFLPHEYAKLYPEDLATA